MTQDRKEYKNAQMRQRRKSARDIGPIPAVVNPRRRARCKNNLKLFLKTYLPESFPDPFGSCHLEAIEVLQNCLLYGELFCLAMPRAYGKTTLTEGATIWATVYAHRHYTVIIGSNQKKANKILRSIKKGFEINDLLKEDFPEICFPVEQLEGISLRAGGQLQNGKPTHIQWGTSLILPTIEGSKSSGIIIESVGMKGSIRGGNHSLDSGKKIRPDFVLLDDPQDREDAESVGETNNREEIIRSDALGLAGFGKKIAGVMLCTVIAKGDLADRHLDHKLHPEWQGRVTSMVKRFPAAKDTLWLQYFILRREGLADGDKGKAANAFYRKNRKAMDKDAVVSWEYGKNKGETAIQTAMNLLCDRGEEAFYAEYQNQPIDTMKSLYILEEKNVLRNINALQRYEVPVDANMVVASLDVNPSYGITFVVMAFKYDWTAWVIDYGIYDEVDKTMRLTDTQYVAGLLINTLDELDKRPYSEKLKAVVIDRGNSPESVKSVIKSSRRRYPVHALLGRATTNFKTPKDVPFGDGWYFKEFENVRTITVNVDIYKTQAHRAFLLPLGMPASVSLWNADSRSDRAFSQQITNELLTNIVEDGRHTWTERNKKHDALDCVTYCYTSAAALGCGRTLRQLQTKAKTKPRGPVEATYSDI